MNHFFESLEQKDLWIKRCKFCFLNKLYIPTTLISLICLISCNDPVDKMYFNDLFEKSLDVVEEKQVIPTESTLSEWKPKIDEEFFKYLLFLFGKVSHPKIFASSSGTNYLETMNDVDSDVDAEETLLDAEHQRSLHPLLQVSLPQIPIPSSSTANPTSSTNEEDAVEEDEDETLSETSTTLTTSSITSTTISTTSSVFNNAPTSPRISSTTQPSSITSSSTLYLPPFLPNLDILATAAVSDLVNTASTSQPPTLLMENVTSFLEPLSLSNRQLFQSSLSLRFTNQLVQWSGFIHPLIIYSSVANLLRKKEDDEDISIELNLYIIKCLDPLLSYYKEASPNSIHPMLSNFMSLTYHEIGYVYSVSRRDFSQGLPYYEKAMLYDQKNAIHFCNRAVAYRELMQLKKAIQDFAIAEKLDPQHRSLYFSRGLLYKRHLYDDKRALLEYIKSYHAYEKVLETKAKLKQQQTCDETIALHYSNVVSVPSFWYNGYVRCASIFYDWDEEYLGARNYRLAEEKSGKVFLNKGISDAQNEDFDEAQSSLMFFYFHH